MKRNSLKMPRKRIITMLSLIIMMSILCDSFAIIGNAVSYYTIRINYVFKNGTPAHDAYVATYPEGANIDLTVTNPAIDGFVPMTSVDGGVSAATTFQYDSLDTNHTELHFLLSWTNSAKTNNGWNYGVQRVLHFTYENYIELLPKEIELAENSENGYQTLIDNGTYVNVIERTFTDTISDSPTYGQSITRTYGLPADNRIETTDSGDQYPFKSDPNQRSQNDGAVRTNQTAVDIKGFKIENYSKDKTGKVALDDSNTSIDWSQDTADLRHATIKFFYHRNHYLLKWRNGNRLESEHTRDVMSGAPLNSAYAVDDGEHAAGEYRYWYENPEYFNKDLRDYYNFMGWYYTPYYYRQVDKDTAIMPADDITLYAKWEPKIINVSFYPTYNDYYSGTNRIGDQIPVYYGDYLEISDIPANIEDDANNLRPDLVPPTTGTMFAGWYYIRDNVPYRFDPENIPITALNYEAS